MKTFATYALMATALAVKLHMLEQETAEQTETERVMDMTVDDFTGEELECISMAVQGGLREKGMGDEEIKETREAFEGAAEEGATLGDGVEELKRMAKDAGMDSDEAGETLEKMFKRAHRCAEKKKEGKDGEESAEEVALAQEGEEGEGTDAELKELMESTAADLGEKKLGCMGKAIKKGLKDRGVGEAEADGVVDVLATGAEAGKKVKEGVDYMRALGEEAGLDTDEQDEVLLDMAKDARECAEAPTESEDDGEATPAELAQEEGEESDDGEGPASDDEGEKKERKGGCGKGKKDKKDDGEDSGEETPDEE